jgi:hypothetical protein
MAADETKRTPQGAKPSGLGENYAGARAAAL